MLFTIWRYLSCGGEDMVLWSLIENKLHGVRILSTGERKHGGVYTLPEFLQFEELMSEDCQDFRVDRV